MDDHRREGRNPIIRVRAYGGQGGRGNLRENREDPAPTVGIAGIPLRQTERFWVVRCGPLIVTRRAMSLRAPPTPTCPCGRSPQGREESDNKGARIWWTGRAGESSRKPRRPRPYSRHCGDTIAPDRAFLGSAMRPPNRDAARHVATNAPGAPNFDHPGHGDRYAPSPSSRPGVDVHPQAAMVHPDEGRFPPPPGRQVGQPTRHREAGGRCCGCL